MKSVLVLSIAMVATLTAHAPSLEPPPKKPAVPAAAAHPWVLKIGQPAAAERFILEGRILGVDGQPRRDVKLQIHHANAKGQYSAAAGGPLFCSGTLRTNVMGEYRIETELPGMAEGNPHVHLALEEPGGGFRAWTLSLARKSGPGTDAAYGRLPWMLELPREGAWTYVARDGDGVLHAHWDIHVGRGVASTEPPEGWSTK